MKIPHTKTPSLRALTALNLIAETGSVSETADRLSVTHSAVSHMIRSLEETLGTPLTRRSGRGVILTREGQHYAARIAPALRQIGEAAHSFSAVAGPLRLNIAGGFAANWLVPRLHRFQASFPDINLELETPRAYGDLGGLTADLYITFARESEVPNGAQHLMNIEFFPLCAPNIANRLSTPKDLIQHPLLHLTTRNDWANWLKSSDMEAPDKSGILFDEMQIMLAATIAGQGICLGDKITADEALTKGTLQRPFAQTLKSDRAYWLVTGNAGSNPASSAFQEWLLAEFSNNIR